MWISNNVAKRVFTYLQNSVSIRQRTIPPKLDARASQLKIRMTLSQDFPCTAQYLIVEAKRAADAYAAALAEKPTSVEGVNEKFTEVRIFFS